jgi:hypothetical protein
VRRYGQESSPTCPTHSYLSTLAPTQECGGVGAAPPMNMANCGARTQPGQHAVRETRGQPDTQCQARHTGVHIHGLHVTGSHADTRARNSLSQYQAVRRAEGRMATVKLSANSLTQLLPRLSGNLCLVTGGVLGAHVWVVRDQVLEGYAGVVRGAGVRKHAHPEATAASYTQLESVLPAGAISVSPSLRTHCYSWRAYTVADQGHTTPARLSLRKCLLMLEGLQSKQVRQQGRAERGSCQRTAPCCC